ncbi:MAG: FecR domain-containing protein [Pseudomonadota bacterium]
MTSGEHDTSHIPREDLREEARDWVVRLASGEMEAAEIAEFEVWRAQSSDHEAAFAFEQAVWLQADSFRQQLGPSSWAAEDVEAPAGLAPIPIPPPPARDHRPVWRTASAAGMAAAAMLSVWIFANDVWLAFVADHRSASGEKVEVTLPDGSTASLNTDSAIGVRFTNEERRISLLQGEAYFDVRSDKTRPFLVSAEGFSARAVGTAFAVREDDGKIIVTVTEGTVEVAAEADGGTAAKPVTATMDQQVVTGHDSHLSPAREIDSTQALAWRTGKIVLEDVPFAQAIAELDRYRPGRIVIAGTARKGPVSGIFSSSSLDHAIGTVAALKGMRVRTVTPYLTVLY